MDVITLVWGKALCRQQSFKMLKSEVGISCDVQSSCQRDRVARLAGNSDVVAKRADI